MGGLRKSFYRFYSKLVSILVPGLTNSQYAYKDVIDQYLKPNDAWLEMGCGHAVLQRWMDQAEKKEKEFVARSGFVAGIDFEFASLLKHETITHRLVGDGGFLPFANNSFDLITANMVAEHIEFPEQVLEEVNRVLVPGGIFIFHTPNYWNYLTILASIIPKNLKLRLIAFLEGRDETDVFPAFYRLNTPPVVRKLAKQTGFKVVELKVIKTSAETVMLGPLVAIELLLIRIFEWKVLENFRSIILAVLRKVPEKPPQ